jgi:hypothetical protein
MMFDLYVEDYKGFCCSLCERCRQVLTSNNPLACAHPKLTQALGLNQPLQIQPNIYVRPFTARTDQMETNK